MIVRENKIIKFNLTAHFAQTDIAGNTFGKNAQQSVKPIHTIPAN